MKPEIPAICVAVPIPIFIGASYFIGKYFDSGIPLYIGILVSVVLALPVVWLIGVLTILYWNPEKYKELDIKKRRIEWRKEGK